MRLLANSFLYIMTSKKKDVIGGKHKACSLTSTFPQPQRHRDRSRTRKILKEVPKNAIFLTHKSKYFTRAISKLTLASALEGKCA